jgi:eukaryotic-like serine/threonine-protein kinase
MSGPGFIRPRTDDSGAPRGERLVRARGLPADFLREASRRLALVGAAAAAGFAFALVVNALARAQGWYVLPHPLAHAVLCLVMSGISVCVWRLSASGRLPPQHLLDLGLVYEVVVAFAISLGDHLTPLSTYRPLEEISWLCVWIAMFPLVVPASPGKTLLASLAAASTWPLAYAIGVALGNPAPPVRYVVLNSLEGFIAAGLALLPSLILRRLGADVQKAREMGSYELVERLDRGGMGEVWSARHRMLARPAAIKLIRPEALGTHEGPEAEALTRRFEREAQATAALHSPHTIELYDFGVSGDGTFYYVMEILDGLDLERLVGRFGPLPPERAVYLLLQACDSLADAHHSGLIHRDIKPANLYTCRKGLRHDFLKVLDFGLVKSSWAAREDGPPLTRDGIIQGTPAYLPPEMATGQHEVDARTDLYALGCVAYWLVTGLPVFGTGTPLELATRHVVAAPVPPSQRPGCRIPASLERLILSCLEKDPARRPARAEELARGLSACELEEQWTPERARRWWETHLPRPERA